jgi:hypothetical protein
MANVACICWGRTGQFAVSSAAEIVGEVDEHRVKTRWVIVLALWHPTDRKSDWACHLLIPEQHSVIDRTVANRMNFRLFVVFLRKQLPLYRRP